MFSLEFQRYFFMHPEKSHDPLLGPGPEPDREFAGAIYWVTFQGTIIS